MVQINLVLLGRPVAGLVEIAESHCFNSRNAGSGVAQPVRKPTKKQGFELERSRNPSTFSRTTLRASAKTLLKWHLHWHAVAIPWQWYLPWIWGKGSDGWDMMDGARTRYQQDSVG